MKRWLLLVSLAVLLCETGFSEPQITYVGEGRYACRGSVRECERTQRKNDRLELKRLQNRWEEEQKVALKKSSELVKQERKPRVRDAR
jgi:hypothetical protein